MEERRDYAVLRFVDQNGWSYMVNDYAKGCSLMEYIKQGIRVEKETVFEWIRQLSKQLEQYYRCGNEDAAYGYVNPYAVIITGDGMLCLLDINEPENEELLKQMKKKKLRMLFVRKERVLSQKTERSDDLYGLAKIMEFTAEKCLDPKAFTRKEERVWKRMLGKCYSSGKNAIKVLKNMQKEIGFLEREMERPRDKVSAKKILLAILAVCIMSAAIIGGTVKKPETKAIAADQDQPEAEVQEGVKEKKETKEVVEQNGDSPYLEMGLIYYVAWEDYVNSLDSLDKEMQETEFSDAYRVVIASLEEGSIQQQEDGLNAEDAVKNAMKKIKGAYALVVSSPRKLIGARDPFGLKPLCIGKRDNTWFLASESCALAAVGADFIRDVEPGEIVSFTKHGVSSDKSMQIPPEKQARCIFEYIYFARMDSVIDNINVYHARIVAGKALAQSYPVEADLVVGVPDSGLVAAKGYSEYSGIPYGMAFHKNSYVGRTFIKPKQSQRESSVKIKLNVIEEVVRGKRIVMVDDSIVRGTTCANIIKMLKKAGAKEVHVRISSPPFLHPCYFGTDVPSNDQLIAHSHTTEQIREMIGADSLGYMEIDKLKDMVGDLGYCDACFTGNYPMRVPGKDISHAFESEE